MHCFWITGACGFIGRHLAKRLYASGHCVAGLDCDDWSPAEANLWGISYFQNGYVTKSSLAHMHDQLGKPDGIYHLAGGSSVAAAFVNPHEDFKRTVDSTAILLEWVRKHSLNTPIVVVSSAAVYGAGHVGLIHENSELSPYSPYGAHKLMMEELCKSYAKNFGLLIAIPRLFSVYGEGLNKQLLWDTCLKLKTFGEAELGGTGAELRDWTYISDVTAVLEQQILLADKTVPIINVATGTPVSVRDVTSMLASAWSFERPPPIIFTGMSRPGDPLNLCADITKLNRLNLACTTSLNKSIVAYVDWFRALRVSV